MEETSYKRTIMAVLLTVIITAALVIAAMYVWSNTFMQVETDMNTEKLEDVEDTITELQDKIKVLEEEKTTLENQLNDLSDNVVEEEETVTDPNVFSIKDIKEGDKIVEMIISGISAQKNDEGEFLPYGRISFSGEMELQGSYVYYDDDEAFIGGNVCFEDLKESSQVKMPKLKEDSRRTWFCFRNAADAQKAFAPQGSKGEATILIDNYEIVHIESEVWNLADLLEVVEIQS